MSDFIAPEPPKPKMWLTLVCGENSIDDIRELWEPIKDHFAGLCAVCHAHPKSEEAIYLEANKKDGRIVYLPYVGRHDLSRIVAVHCGVIQDGQIVVQFDALERLNPSFAAAIPELVTNLSQVDAFFYYGKIFIYRYHESVTFSGTPHEGWHMQHKRAVTLELSKAYPNEKDVRLNVRPLKRDAFHFVNHYLGYYLHPWGSNHLRLGADRAQAAGISFEDRENRRMAFREFCRKQGIGLKANEVIEYMVKHKQDAAPEFKDHVQNEKILNDVWRYHVMGLRDFGDDHDHKNLVDIP